MGKLLIVWKKSTIGQGLVGGPERKRKQVVNISQWLVGGLEREKEVKGDLLLLRETVYWVYIMF